MTLSLALSYYTYLLAPYNCVIIKLYHNNGFSRCICKQTNLSSFDFKNVVLINMLLLKMAICREIPSINCVSGFVLCILFSKFINEVSHQMASIIVSNVSLLKPNIRSNFTHHSADAVCKNMHAFLWCVIERYGVLGKTIWKVQYGWEITPHSLWWCD